VSGDTCARAKPHPMPLLHAAELMGVAPEACLYLGDDLRDMEAAQAALMTGIIAAYGYIDPTANLAMWPDSGQISTPFALLRYIHI
jgi:phosphoglycolate phosphatase